VSQKCALTWDLDNDGDIDPTPEPDADRVIRVTDGLIGSQVVLKIKCPDGERSVTRSVRLADLKPAKEWR
jgi:hypothetical protein